jgi:hypothetical protein
MDMTAQTVDTAGTTGEVHRIDLFRPHTGLLDDRANRGCNLITQCQCTQIKAFTVQVQRRCTGFQRQLQAGPALIADFPVPTMRFCCVLPESPASDHRGTPPVAANVQMPVYPACCQITRYILQFAPDFLGVGQINRMPVARLK